MPLLNWKPSYSVQVPELDCHHQRLFAMFNKLYENVVNSADLKSILLVIDEFYDYTNYHFSAEEEHMRAINYIDLAAHIEKHQELTLALDTLRSKYRNNDLEVARELIIILGEWLLHHVLRVDQKFAEFITDLPGNQTYQ